MKALPEFERVMLRVLSDPVVVTAPERQERRRIERYLVRLLDWNREAEMLFSGHAGQRRHGAKDKGAVMAEELFVCPSCGEESGQAGEEHEGKTRLVYCPKCGSRISDADYAHQRTVDPPRATGSDEKLPETEWTDEKLPPKTKWTNEKLPKTEWTGGSPDEVPETPAEPKDPPE